MSNNEFKILAISNKPVIFSAKKLLYSEGVNADAFYAIVSGSVLMTGSNMVVSAPATVGIEDVLLGGTYSSSVIAVNEVSVIKIEKENIKNFIKLCPEQITDVMKRILGVGEDLPEIANVIPKPEKTQVVPTTPPASAVVSDKDGQSPQQRLGLAIKSFNIPQQHRLYSDSIAITTEAKFLHTTEYSCPVCNQRFNEKSILFSLLRVMKTHLDLRVEYQDFDPLWYSVIVCPKCKYANTEKKFADIGGFEAKNILKRLSDAGVGDIKDIYTPTRNIDDIFMAYYDALFCSESIGDNSVVKATLWLNLVWLYEDVGDTVMIDVASRKALECYNHIYNQTRLFETPEEEQQIFMILAELNIRVGDKQQAMNFLSEAFRSDSSNRMYKERCRRRFDDLKYGEE